MTAVADAARAVETALRAVPGLRVYTDPGAGLDPPAAVVGPPALSFETYAQGPTSARFLVYLVERADARTLERLWELVPAAVVALEAVADDAVMAALPTRYPSGNVDLPAYELTCEVSL